MTRPFTPDRTNADGSTTITTKRACNGCGQTLGDATDAEMGRAITGLPLPDVRGECPTCGSTAPEPSCTPVKLAIGDVLCLELECDHDGVSEDSYCEEVGEEVVCAIHSTFTTGFEEAYEIATHAEPWPCQHQNTGGAR